jgi:glycosyltransferase involved in cell wall biosynthesis
VTEDRVTPDRLLVISPCRDEAAHVRRTLESVCAQSVLPALWVVVDDGSHDGTRAILDEFAARHAWIRIVERADRGERAVGPGVIEAFYAGLATVNPGDHDFLLKRFLTLRRAFSASRPS